MSAFVFSQRAVQLSMRRLAASNPSSITKSSSLLRLSAPAAIATGRHVQYRAAATSSVSNDEAYNILTSQRRNRPVSPHLSIYKPQITWYPSMFNRITGAMMSGTFYVFGIAYLVAPAIGWHLESASIAAAFATWPIAAKVFTKFICALPFTFHSINGIRHLIWDTARMFTNKQVAVTGWAAVILSFASALYFTLY